MAAKKLICASCGSQGKPIRVCNGSLLLEIFAWLCFLLPGLLYSLWRQSTYRTVCKTCGSAELVPLNTPRGKKLLQEFSA